MQAPILNRFSPLFLSTRHSLKNRVVVPPMASGTATRDGFVTPETVKHYSRLAQAGAGLLIVEYSFVHPSGRSEEQQLGISSHAQISGLSELVKVIHQQGSLAGIQLTHSGGKSSRELTAGALMAPSAIAVPVKEQQLETPSPMSLADIELWKSSFSQAAHRAVLAGFDLVEFHSAHGYGLNQWLSPLTNQRQDEYGRDLAGRSKLLQEIIQIVRRDFPGLLTSVRMPGQDFLAGGLTVDETTKLAKALEQLGVDIINVSSGIGGWRRPSSRTGEGYLAEEAARIQASVCAPVIAVGGIVSGEYIDDGVLTNRFRLAAVGRAILEDPKAWYEKNMRRSI